MGVEAPMRLVGLAVTFVFLAAGMAAVQLTAQDEAPLVEVYKTPT